MFRTFREHVGGRTAQPTVLLSWTIAVDCSASISGGLNVSYIRLVSLLLRGKTAQPMNLSIHTYIAVDYRHMVHPVYISNPRLQSSAGFARPLPPPVASLLVLARVQPEREA